MNNRFKCLSPIMTDKIFYIFQYECIWLFLLDYTGNIEKQRSLGIISKPLLQAAYRKSLTWKSCKKQIKIRNVFFINLSNIPYWSFTKIRFITLCRKLVYITAEQTLPFYSQLPKSLF